MAINGAKREDQPNQEQQLDFSPLQRALASGNAEIVNRMIALLQQTGNVDLKLCLQGTTKDGFMPLRQALASANAESEIDLYEDKEQKETKVAKPF